METNSSPSSNLNKGVRINLWIIVAGIITLVLLTAFVTYTLVTRSLQTAKQQVNNTPPQPIQSVHPPTPSPTVDETVGWETYRNEEYGFEFKYPDEWYRDVEGEREDYVRIQNYDPATAPQREYIPEEDSDKFAVEFNVWSMQNKQVMSVTELEAELNKSSECVNGETKSTGFENTTTINEITVFSRMVDCVSTTWHEYYLLDEKGLVVQAVPILATQSNRTQFDQILSTFRFLEGDTSNTQWKTYENATYGFSLQYHSYWKDTPVGYPGPGSNVLMLKSDTINEETKWALLNVTVYDSEEEYIKDDYVGSTSEYLKSEKINDVSIKYYERYDGYIALIPLKNNQVLQIRVNQLEKDKQEALKRLNEILDTFKFNN